MNRSLNSAKRVFECRARMNCYLPKFRIVMKSNGDITDNKISRSNQIPNAASLPSFVAISDAMNKFLALNLYKYTSIDYCYMHVVRIFLNCFPNTSRQCNCQFLKRFFLRVIASLYIK